MHTVYLSSANSADVAQRSTACFRPSPHAGDARQRHINLYSLEYRYRKERRCQKESGNRPRRCRESARKPDVVGGRPVGTLVCGVLESPRPQKGHSNQTLLLLYPLCAKLLSGQYIKPLKAPITIFPTSPTLFSFFIVITFISVYKA